MASGERILFANRLLAVGEFHCEPENWRWRDVNSVGDRSYVVFPGTSVVINQLGHEPILTNPNHVVFYRRRQRFLRALHDPRGDHCVFVWVAQELVTELLAASAVAHADDDFPFVHGPSDPHAHVALRCATHALRRGRLESLAAEEVVLDAVRRSVERGADVHARRRVPARKGTDRQHHALVEEAKSLLTQRVTMDDTLASLATTLHVSEFHLSRVFRERTGFTLHRYRVHLRLRLALDRLAERETDLSTIARQAGFASHSHFTGAFRAVFGSSPSHVRNTLGSRELLHLRDAGAPLLSALGAVAT